MGCDTHFLIDEKGMESSHSIFFCLKGEVTHFLQLLLVVGGWVGWRWGGAGVHSVLMYGNGGGGLLEFLKPFYRPPPPQ